VLLVIVLSAGVLHLTSLNRIRKTINKDEYKNDDFLLSILFFIVLFCLSFIVALVIFGWSLFPDIIVSNDYRAAEERYFNNRWIDLTVDFLVILVDFIAVILAFKYDPTIQIEWFNKTDNSWYITLTKGKRVIVNMTAKEYRMKS